eukprot:jgi/Mesvir1/10603/Mv08932-RA.2
MIVIDPKTGQPYYVNTKTLQACWEKPKGYMEQDYLAQRASGMSLLDAASAAARHDADQDTARAPGGESWPSLRPPLPSSSSSSSSSFQSSSTTATSSSTTSTWSPANGTASLFAATTTNTAATTATVTTAAASGANVAALRAQLQHQHQRSASACATSALGHSRASGRLGSIDAIPTVPPPPAAPPKMDPELQQDIHKFQMLQYAQEYFRQPRKSFFRLYHPIPLERLVVFSKAPLLRPLTKIADAKLQLEAVRVFKSILTFMGDGSADKKKLGLAAVALSVLQAAAQDAALCDEIYCQLLKQTTDHPVSANRLRGWQLLYLMSGISLPSPPLLKVVRTYFQETVEAGSSRTADPSSSPGGSASGANESNGGTNGAAPPLAHQTSSSLSSFLGREASGCTGADASTLTGGAQPASGLIRGSSSGSSPPARHLAADQTLAGMLQRVDSDGGNGGTGKGDGFDAGRARLAERCLCRLQDAVVWGVRREPPELEEVENAMTLPQSGSVMFATLSEIMVAQARPDPATGARVARDLDYPAVLRLLFSTLNQGDAIRKPGLFRTSAGADELRETVRQLSVWSSTLHSNNPLLVANVLQQWLMKLVHPVILQAAYPHLQTALRQGANLHEVARNHLPHVNMRVLELVLDVLARTAAAAEAAGAPTSLGASGMGVCLAPCLLRNVAEGQAMLAEAQWQVEVVSNMVKERMQSGKGQPGWPG